MAAQTSLRTRLVQEGFYDDNAGFTSGDETPSLGTTSTAVLALTGRNPTTSLTLDGRFDFVRYFQESDLNTNNQYVGLRANHAGRRLELDLDASFTRDVSRDDDIETTGDVQLNNERQQTISIDPSATYKLTPTQSLILSGTYLHRTYPQLSGANDDDLLFGPGLRNYDQYGASLAWLTAVNPRLSAGVVPSFVYLDTPIQNVSQTSLQGIVEYQLTPRFRFDARVGPSLINSETRTLDTATLSEEEESDTELGYVVDAGFFWQVARNTDINTRYTHAVEPSGSEAAVTRDRVRIELSHALYRDVRLFATGIFQRQEQVTSGAGSSDRTSVRFEPGVEWDVYEDVALSLRYRLRYVEFGDSSITSNAVLLNIGVRLPELRSSW